MEDWELEGRRGFTTEHGTIDNRRKVGSAKPLELDRQPAERIRTKGRNVIPEIKAVWELVDGRMKCTKEGSPTMLAYIDEIRLVHRRCYKCRKFLSNAQVNYQMKFRWHKYLHTAIGYDVFTDNFEESICNVCKEEVEDEYYSKR